MVRVVGLVFAAALASCASDTVGLEGRGPSLGERSVDAGSGDADSSDASDASCGVARTVACSRELREEGCMAAGGVWQSAGMWLWGPWCQCPAGDADCPCTTHVDCDGMCISPTLGRDDCVEQPGVCSPYLEMPGCFCYQGAPDRLSDGVVTAYVCSE